MSEIILRTGLNDTSNIGWGKSRCIVVPMENSTIMISNDTRIHSVFHVTYNHTSTFASPCVLDHVNIIPGAKKIMEAFSRIRQSFNVKLVGKIVVPLGGVQIFHFFKNIIADITYFNVIQEVPNSNTLLQ